MASDSKPATIGPRHTATQKDDHDRQCGGLGSQAIWHYAYQKRRNHPEDHNGEYRRNNPNDREEHRVGHVELDWNHRGHGEEQCPDPGERFGRTLLVQLVVADGGPGCGGEREHAGYEDRSLPAGKETTPSGRPRTELTRKPCPIIEKTMMLNEIQASFRVRIAIRRCHTALSETLGRSGSSSITSPIVESCSNWPRGGSGTKRDQIPSATIGQANTQ